MKVGNTQVRLLLADHIYLLFLAVLPFVISRTARAASALQPPKRLASAVISGEFKLPMLLPGEASLWTASPLATARELEVRDVAGAKPHLRGRFQWTLQ